MLGLVSISFREISTEKLVDICVKEGIQAIEWGADVHVPPDNLENARKVKAYCDKNGISTPTYGSYYHIGVEEHKGNVDFSTLVATAKVLGAKTIRVWPSKTASGEATPEFIEKCAEELRGLCKIAGDEGIGLGMEYHWGTLTDTAESALHLIECTGVSNLKTYWQMNYNRTSEEHLKEIQLLKGHIANVHAYFWEGRNRLPFAEGEEVWREYISLLKDEDVPFMFEHLKDDSLEALSADTIVLKKLLKEVYLY